MVKKGRYYMDIIDYATAGGKNLIETYLDNLPKKNS